ncbi:glycosyltransferase family 61 protein [uncultured Roseobacter sp.]|uniref:glycosyltransferase family 61 protein n=1 Tax=uncultured Roseobacter sp. TaxID=114847 RepID=UPI002631FC0B|nr:glycosyltransferase family 61 protein [uncultured Roseobacter sp.]
MPADKTDALNQPSVVATAQIAAAKDSFVLSTDLVDAQFHRRSPVLFVTFDNLGSVGEYDPPQPWLHARVAKAGFSILGLIARRKDWYRNADTPRLLEDLRDAGLFDGFQRIVFTGTSMGAYAALTYARIVPGSDVLAFSPQTTLNQKIAPFEHRFKYALRKWDWEAPAFLDAAEAIPRAGQILLFYDPFVREDRAHAMRLQDPRVIHVKCRHFGHRLIRQLKSCGVLEDLIAHVGNGRFDEVAFQKSLRNRRDIRAWCREMLENSIKAHHLKLTDAALGHLEKREPGARHLAKLRDRLDARRAIPIARDIIYTDGSPQQPFSGRIVKAGYAKVVPERPHDTKLASGVLLADGRYCDLSRTWIRASKATPPPVLSREEPLQTLSGTHLFGGHIRGHFGHFLVESTARLWALEKLDTEIESLLYLPFRGAAGKARRARRALKSFFDQLNLKVPIRIVDKTVEVEALYVPELGFGWRDRYAGSPLYRQLVRDRLGRDVQAEGCEKLYISRARLPSQRGGILGEQFVEDNLAQQGYDIFHPERHPLEVQIARYKAARQVVALDGSALHFAAFCLPLRPKLCIILRRSQANVADYIKQYQTFCEVTPDVIDVVCNDLVSRDAKRVNFRSVGELDFQALFEELKRLDYVAHAFKPVLPSSADLNRLAMEVPEGADRDYAAGNQKD